MKLQGIFPSITTPFGHSGNLYAAKVQHNVEQWNRTTLAGYFVCGSAGEGAMLAHEEKVQMFEMVARHASAEKLLIAGTGAESVRETICLTRRAAASGYRAASVITPHYYKDLMGGADAQMLYYRAVADQAAIPIVIYNRPQDTGVNISAEAVVQLSAHPNIIAAYEDSPDLGKIMQIQRDSQPGFQVLTGSALSLWPSLLMGAAGAILAVANAVPYATIAIWEAYRMREEEAGRDWQDRIARAALLVTSKYGIPGLKYAMDLNGYYGGPPRLPLSVPTADAKREIEEAFRDLKG